MITIIYSQSSPVLLVILTTEQLTLKLTKKPTNFKFISHIAIL